jgi:FtsH-binding integral membrane protein
MGFSLPVTTGLVRTGEERATLVRRTYTLVFFSILVTMVGATYGMSNMGLMQQVAAHPFLSGISIFIPLFIIQGVRNRFPLNIAMVMLFTFGWGVLLSPYLFAVRQTEPGLIGQAAGLTVGAFAVLTLYAFVSRRDFSAWGSFFMVGLLVLIGTTFLNSFFHNATADLWLAAGTIVIFSGLLVFDTWRLRNVFGPDDYVLAAVQIYLDLLNLFLAILSILGGNRRR